MATESPLKSGDDSPLRDPDLSSVANASDDEAILPAGTLDPVYEAKAKVLNRAVRSTGRKAATTFLTTFPHRSKTLAWGGTNGSSSLS